MGEISPVEEIKRVYQVVTDMDNAIIIEAVSDKGEDTYGYTIEGVESTWLSTNDTEYIIDALNRATEWINTNSEVIEK